MRRDHLCAFTGTITTEVMATFAYFIVLLVSNLSMFQFSGVSPLKLTSFTVSLAAGDAAKSADNEVLIHASKVA